MKPIQDPKPIRTFWFVAMGLCLFALVFSIRLWATSKFGSDMPTWDQWDAEADKVYLPYLQHRLSFLDLFSAHNEHRIFFTKLLGLGLLVTNGQWDARLQCVVNAALHAGVALGTFTFLAEMVAPVIVPIVCMLIGLAFGLPVASQNVLSGFHSQQVFLVGFSAAAICLLTTKTARTLPWCVGVFFGVAALFSMGSGLLASAAILGVLAFQYLKQPELRRDRRLTIAAAGLTLAFGWALHVSVDYHEPLKAHNATDFFLTCWHNLQWPLRDSWWFAPINILPWGLFTFFFLQHKRGEKNAAAVVGLGVWVLLQIAATGYARGAGGGWPSSRYLDTLLFGLLLNAVILIRLFPTSPRLRIVYFIFAATWFGCVGIGLYKETQYVLNDDFPAIGREYRLREENVRQYLQTGDFAWLQPPKNIPYPGARTLQERLSHPEIRAILPVTIRAPLKIPARYMHSDVLSFQEKFSLPNQLPRNAWSSIKTGIGAWESWPVNPGFAYWKIEVIGYPGAEGCDLSINAPGETSSHLSVRNPPLNDWKSVYQKVPDAAVTVGVQITRPSVWLAFTEPREMATLSFWTLMLTRVSEVILKTALSLTSVLLALVFVIELRRAIPKRP